jgi:hypothetical protein
MLNVLGTFPYIYYQMSEIWKLIPFSSTYEASTFGNVRHVVNKKNMKLDLDALREKQIRVRVNIKLIDGKRKGFYLHRVIAQTFLPNPNNHSEVNHIDGDPYNNNLSNLEWCSRKENMSHFFKNCNSDIFNTRSVKVLDKNTHAILHTYNSIKECHSCENIATSYNNFYILLCGDKYKKKDDNSVSNNAALINDKLYQFASQDLMYDTNEDSNIIWREYPECHSYLVSDTGLVKHKKLNRILKGYNRNGYRQVTLNSKETTNKNGHLARLVHRVVAQTFIANPENKPMVDHIDTNILNNRVDNLRWVTPKENMNNEDTIKNLKKSKENVVGIPVLQIDIPSGEILKEFISSGKASRELGINQSTIRSICLYWSTKKNKYLRMYKNKMIFINSDDKSNLEQYLIDARNYLETRREKTTGSWKRKKVVQCDKNTGGLIAEFDSMYSATKTLALNYSAVSQVCNYYKYTDADRPPHYKLKTTGGYIFKFI